MSIRTSHLFGLSPFTQFTITCNIWSQIPSGYKQSWLITKFNPHKSPLILCSSPYSIVLKPRCYNIQTTQPNADPHHFALRVHYGSCQPQVLSQSLCRRQPLPQPTDSEIDHHATQLCLGRVRVQVEWLSLSLGGNGAQEVERTPHEIVHTLPQVSYETIERYTLILTKYGSIYCRGSLQQYLQGPSALIYKKRFWEQVCEMHGVSWSPVAFKKSTVSLRNVLNKPTRYWKLFCPGTHDGKRLLASSLHMCT